MAKNVFTIKDFMALSTEAKFIEMALVRDELNHGTSIVSVDIYYDSGPLCLGDPKFVAIIRMSTVLPLGDEHKDVFHLFHKSLDKLLAKCYFFLGDPVTANVVDHSDLSTLNKDLDKYIEG